MTDRRDGERRRGGLGSEDPSGPDRRRGDRRARASAGVVLAVAALAASVRADPGYVGAPVPIAGPRQLPRVPSAGAEALLRAAGPRPSRNTQFDLHIKDAAARHDVSEDLIRAIIQVESGFDRRAVSAAGARGLMQLMPATARRFGVVNRFDARQNIFGGTRYLRALLDLYRGDISLTAAAYNAGENCVARYHGIPPYRETNDYVRKVTALLGMTREGADGDEDSEGRPDGKG